MTLTFLDVIRSYQERLLERGLGMVRLHVARTYLPQSFRKGLIGTYGTLKI